MKKIHLIIIAIAISFPSIGQQVDSIPKLNKEDYLIKSKRQKTTGFILLGGGLLTTGIGFAIGVGEGLGNLFVPEQDRSNNGEGIAIAGLVIMGSSIPFFIASSSSRKKAISISLKNEKASLIGNNGFSYTLVPSLSVKMRL